MLSAAERTELNRSLDQFVGKPYADIAIHLTERFGREITRNTVRYYAGLVNKGGPRARGRPKGAERRRGLWDWIIPELLVLTGLPASRLYREICSLLAPTKLPFHESAFHERTSVRKRVQDGGARDKQTTVLTRCRLRMRVIEVMPIGAQRKRVYLFGYEELTGYTSFDLLPNSQPDVPRVARFVKGIEQHLGLPICRVLTNIELPESFPNTYLPHTEVEQFAQQSGFASFQSPFGRKAEIDWLERTVKKQNNDVARGRAMEAKLAMTEFVRSEKGDRTWRRLSERDLSRRKLAETLELWLGVRFKLRTPSRSPQY